MIHELAQPSRKATCLRIATWVRSNPKHGQQLIDAFLAGPSRISQQASWPITVLAEQAPHVVLPHLGKLVRAAGKTSAPTAVKRNVMRSLQFLPIPAPHQSAVVNLAMSFLTNRQEAIAVRVFAMTVLANLCSVYPDLKNELIPLIEVELPIGTPAFRSRGAKILRSLKRHPVAL